MLLASALRLLTVLICAFSLYAVNDNASAWEGPGDGPLHGRRLRSTADTPEHPGIVELLPSKFPDLNATLHLIRCRNYASAYSAAWLAPVTRVMKTRYKDRVTLEWHSHNLYLSTQAGAYKLEEHVCFACSNGRYGHLQVLRAVD